MENNTKICPKCGNECCIGDLYCTKCSYKFSNEKTQKQERKKKVDEYSNDIKNDTSDETLDTSLVLEISPEEAANGTTKTITVDYGYDKELEIEIPSNVVEGTKLCYENQGYPNDKGESGNLYVIIKIVNESENLQNQINIPSWLNILFIIIAILLVGLKAYIFYKNVHGSSTQNKIQKQTEQLSLACDDENIKNSVIQNFKSNDKMYSAIDRSSIADIDLIYPSQINYDQSSDTYYCRGVVVLKSFDNGFKPSYETLKNEYYNLIYQYNEHNGEEKLSKNTKYEYDIEYKSYVSNNKPTVTVMSDYDKTGEFSCSGNCEPEILRFANKEPQYDYNSTSYENNSQNYNYSNYSDYSYSDSYSDTTSPNNNLADNSNSAVSSSANTVNNTQSEPDFKPFMKNLQEKIKRNWNPPQVNSAQKVVVKMKIAKDGQLLSVNIIKSSGVQIVDNAAMYAVRASAPFNPLPADCKEPSVDVEFTFDYNVNNIR